MSAYATLLKQYAKRRDQICALHAQGWTLERIGRRYGISRQRVSEITRSQISAERRNGART